MENTLLINFEFFIFIFTHSEVSMQFDEKLAAVPVFLWEWMVREKVSNVVDFLWDIVCNVVYLMCNIVNLKMVCNVVDLWKSN